MNIHQKEEDDVSLFFSAFVLLSAFFERRNFNDIVDQESLWRQRRGFLKSISAVSSQMICAHFKLLEVVDLDGGFDEHFCKCQFWFGW